MLLRNVLTPKIIAPALAVAFALTAGVFIGWERYTTGNERFCMNCHSSQGQSEFWRTSSLHPEGIGCPSCHAEAGQFIPRDFSADPERVNDNCARCHESMFTDADEMFVETPSGLEFPHRSHLEDIGAVCTDCHQNIRHIRGDSPSNQPHMTACLSCHEDTKNDCKSCHARQHAIYTGATGWIEDEEPNWMAEAGVGCDGCHVVSEMPEVRVSVVERCLVCHDEDPGYAEMVDEWQTRFRELIDELDGLLVGKDREKEDPAVRRINEISRALESDRSLGVHNPELAIAVLEALSEDL